MVRTLLPLPMTPDPGDSTRSSAPPVVRRLQVSLLAAAILSATLGYGPAAWPGEMPVQQRLEQTIVSVDFDEVSLGKIVERLRSEYGLNIYVNSRALEARRVDLSRPITLRLQEVSLATVLRLLLRDAAGEGPPLTYVVEDEVIVVSTAEDISALPVLRIYDVSDLIDSGFARRRLLNTPLLRLALTGAETQGAEPGGGSSQQNPFQGSADGSLQPAVTDTGATFQRLDELIHVIKEVVAPESWRDAGGSFGSVCRQGNRLVVTAVPAVHRQIESLLDSLRDQLPRTIDLDMALFRVPPKVAEGWRRELAADWPRMSLLDAARIETEAAGAGKVWLRMTTTGAGGQPQIVNSLKQQNYVARVQPVVDESSMGYQPEIGQADSGIELIVLPVLSADGKSVTLDVTLALAARGSVQRETFFKGPDGMEVGVQLSSTGMRTLLSKVRLEREQAVLLALPPAAESLETESADAMFLLIRPMVR